jgi:hypothetical protein
MGLLYEEFHKEKEGWKINRSEFENTIRFEHQGLTSFTRMYWILIDYGIYGI